MSHGGFDQIFDTTLGQKVRRCNWVRFLTVVPKSDNHANLQCFVEETTGLLVLEATENIQPECELKAAFDSNEHSPKFNLANVLLMRAVCDMFARKSRSIFIALIHSAAPLLVIFSNMACL